MPNLGDYLKQLREKRERSRRWVERQSQLLYPDEKERRISHSYLRQIEDGLQNMPNPMKLKTLAEIYEVDHRKILAAAGYLESEMDAFEEAVAPGSPEQRAKLETARKMISYLEANGLHPEFFMNTLMGLGPESLAIMSRLITTLSVQEKQLRQPERLEREYG